MSEQGHLSADLGHDDQFEREMRGYNRREVDEAIAALRITAAIRASALVVAAAAESTASTR